MLNREITIGQTAYAKIVVDGGADNRGLEFYMNENWVELGREPTLKGPNYFCIGESNTISKNHARIKWNEDAFYIENLSKNKVSSIA